MQVVKEQLKFVVALGMLVSSLTLLFGQRQLYKEVYRQLTGMVEHTSISTRGDK